MIIIHLFLWALFYSFVGWIYETVLCSVQQRRFVNRGFLFGPLCPIYGVGAVAVVLILGRVDNPLLLFFLGAFVTCLIEYVTGWLLEALFHAKWWDYSHFRFQLHGRVCLAGALVFGLFSVALVKGIHPFVVSVTERIPSLALQIAAGVFLVLLIFDILFTVRHLLRFNERLHQLQALLNELLEASKTHAESLKKTISETPSVVRLNASVHSFLEHLNRQEKRILNAFPRFQSTRYAGALQKLRDIFRSKKS